MKQILDIQYIIENHLLKCTWLSYLLYPLSLIYSGILILRRIIYRHLAIGYRSRCLIISIGNIVSGGTGKTPVTICLAHYLKEKGYKVAVSHRGYKGEFESSIRLISNFIQVFPEAEKAGDEANLMALRLAGIPVIVGKNRKDAIKKLEKEFNDLEVIILDDSFQHLKVKHDIDIVVFKKGNFIGNGYVLPAGILREPLVALKDSDYIIYNGDGVIPYVLTSYKKRILQGFYDVSFLYDQSGKKVSLDKLKAKKTALISGIGFPKSFEETVSKLGITFERHFIFTDHHQYKEEDINFLKGEDGELFDYLITTEKDFVKLKKIKLLIPVIIVPISLVLPEISRIVLPNLSDHY